MSNLAQVLEERRAEIIQRWTDTVRRQRTAGGVTQAELIDHLPDFLQQLEALLRGESSGDKRSTQGGTQAVARAHGGQRYRLGFSLDELVGEYGVLRELLLDVIEEEDLQVTWGETRQVTRFVATAIAEAVKEHMRQREHAQREAQEAVDAERRHREAERERLLQETERLRAMAEEERSLLSGFIQQVPAIVAILRGPELVLERLNDETCLVWGRAREQLEGKPMMQALPELEHQGFDALMLGVMATGEPYIGTEVPAPVRQPNGTVETRYLSFRYAPWRNHEGRIERLLVVGMDVTETVLARRAVQAERERAERSRRALLEALNAQPLVAVKYQRGPEHVFEMANPLYQELLGRDVMEQPLLGAFSEVASQGVGALRDRVHETGEPYVGREQAFQVRAKDGSLHERLFDFVLQPVLGPDGQVEGILNLLFEVTEQVRLRQASVRQAEEERGHRTSEALLRVQAEGERARLNALFTQAPVAISVLRGPQLVVEVANPGILRIWGRTSEQVVGKPLWDALPELRDKGFDVLLRGVLATGTPFVATEMEIQFARGADGALETGYFNFVYQPLLDERGRPEAVLAIATEVTEAVLARQKVEELLRRSQEAEQARAAVLEALSAQTLIAVCYQRGPELVYETANPLFRHMAGREVVGLSLRAAFPELLDHEETFGSLKRVFETGEPYVVRELKVPFARWLGGPVREGLFDLTYQPVRAPDGGVDGVLTLVLEVTEQVRLRREAQRLAEEERKRRDFEQKLIGIVSHDLRSPLSAILLGTELLMRRGSQDPRTTQSLVRIKSTAERATRMIKDLLDFTQARLGGGLLVERQPMDLHKVTRGVVEEVGVTWPTRTLEVRHEGDGQGELDEDRVAQVVQNLVTNALKYSPEDSPVRVTTWGEGAEVSLCVANGGEPIPADKLTSIFEPMQRATSELDKTGRSVGLGLYIVKSIVEAHQGRIEVVSTPREGTRFTVWLPRRAGAPR